MALNDNLVAYRKFDESSGNASDATGRGHTMTAVNQATFDTGKINNAGKFDGDSDYFKTPDGTDFDFGTGAVSVSFWIYQDALKNYAHVINQRSGNGSSGAQFVIQTTPGAGTGDALTMNFYNGTVGQNHVTNNNSHSATTWEHWVFTRSSDGTETKSYKNGTLHKTISSQTARNADNNGDFCIGDSIGQPTGRNGKIDEVGVWKTTLTADDVTSLYNGGNGLQYPFSSIKTINGLAKASVKTVDGLAIASVKTFNGLA